MRGLLDSNRAMGQFFSAVRLFRCLPKRHEVVVLSSLSSLTSKMTVWTFQKACPSAPISKGGVADGGERRRYEGRANSPPTGGSAPRDRLMSPELESHPVVSS